MLTKITMSVIINSIQRKSKKSPDEKGILRKRIIWIYYIFHMLVRYMIYRIRMKIYERRLNPLDNSISESKNQYVSGMANDRSHRISLNHRSVKEIDK